MKITTTRCDIFCNVIDNYGDIGVCWRLARQLANEFGLDVRLWVDDLGSFAMLYPDADVAVAQQKCRGVEVRYWSAEVFRHLPQPLSRPIGHPLPLAGEGLGERVVADLVIEAFACKLPQNYLEAMAKIQTLSVQEAKMDARRQGFIERDSTNQYSEGDEAAANNADATLVGRKPAWINLEYLSAEDWIDSHHKLPSPHPKLPLTKYFFFPGFTGQAGGLLLERGLFARRDAFRGDETRLHAYWRSIGLDMPSAGTLKVSLFAYENAALPGLFDAWSAGTQPVYCLVPEGRIMPQVGQYFGDLAPHAGSDYMRGQLHVRVLPFVEQDRYDELLWACDVNFVRGEDSLVRALWAGRPFVWQIYPQHDAVHLKKLQAFLMLYGRGLSRPASEAVERLWQGWNKASSETGSTWAAFAAELDEINRCTQNWSRQLAENNLALNLLDFCGEIGRMRALKIEGQQK